MIYSMTGYATAAREVPQGSLSVELKSVNGRFLDVQFRLPDELRQVEPRLRELLSARISRGKIECRIALAPAGASVPLLKLNEPLLAELAKLARRAREIVPDAQPLRAGELLHWPGVLVDDARGDEMLREAALQLVAGTIEEFNSTRRREGDKLAAMIDERVQRMRELLAAIEPRLPEAIAAYQEKLATRLREALAGADEDRIRQEIALFGVKSDVAEELSRLTAHAGEVGRVVASGGACGKRLDFLMQELNREANTLGAKSVSKEIADASLEMKLLIEQMREQVQNIE